PFQQQQRQLAGEQYQARCGLQFAQGQVQPEHLMPVKEQKSPPRPQFHSLRWSSGSELQNKLELPIESGRPQELTLRVSVLHQRLWVKTSQSTRLTHLHPQQQSISTSRLHEQIDSATPASFY